MPEAAVIIISDWNLLCEPK